MFSHRDSSVTTSEQCRPILSSVDPKELFSIKTNPAKSARNLRVIVDKTFTSIHIYQLSAANACTTSGICSAFTVTLTWIVKTHLPLLLCLVVLIIAIQLCMVLLSLTSPNINVFRTNWPRCDKVTSFYSQCSIASFPLLVTSKS